MKSLLLEIVMFLLPVTALFAEDMTGQTMGTTYSIRIPVNHGASDFAVEQAMQQVDERLAEINALMSTYDPDSELSQFNQSDSTDWFNVSEETYVVVKEALRISEASEGAFDPTVGPLVNLWSFGKDDRTYEPPAEEAIQAALENVGYQKLHLQEDPAAIRKDIPGLQLDLSAIAKGYAVDAIRNLFNEHGLENYFIEIGGEIYAQGRKPADRWRAGIESPIEEKRELGYTIELTNEALATSGDYRNYFEKDGVKYSHTINPATGYPVDHQLASASVLAPDCMTADAIATALMVLGTDAGQKFAKSMEVETLLIERTGDGFRGVGSERFVKLQEEPQSVLMTFLITLVAFTLATLGLAAGLFLSKKELKGSCGGIAGTKDEQGKSVCDLCTTPPEECDRVREELAKQAHTADQND